MTEHVALLGDSILDNGAYTPGEPDVAGHLRRLLPDGALASLLARDGSMTVDIEAQVAALPSDVTRAVLSVGGNDAIMESDALDLPVRSTREALRLFGQRATRFEASYRAALAGVVARVPRTVVCTIYNANLKGDAAPTTRVGLMLFNDVILRVAFESGLSVVDLRLVCVEPADYANDIEPSSRGAEKIARAIAEAHMAAAEVVHADVGLPVRAGGRRSQRIDRQFGLIRVLPASGIGLTLFVRCRPLGPVSRSRGRSEGRARWPRGPRRR